jgi:TRAP-type C4-dicarboxylate transport system permease small subunit
MMQRLSDVLRHLALGMLLLGSVGMMASMFLGTADVVGTQFLGTPVPGALEVTESTMVLIVFGALAYAQIRRAHIRVELLYGFMGFRAQAFMDVAAHVTALAFFALLAWEGYHEANYSWGIREATLGFVRFPLYPARWLLVLGAALLLVQLALDVVSDSVRMWRGEPLLAPPASPDLPGTESSQGR